MLKIFVKLFLVLILVFSGQVMVAKMNPYLRPRHNFNLSLFGDASVLSVNYEQLFSNNRKFFLAGNVGIGYSLSMGLPVKNTSLLSVPMHFTGNYGERKHFFEFGLGGTLLFYGDLKFWDYCIYPQVGYRFQPVKKGRFSFRVYAGFPVTDKIDLENYWFFPAGLSVGFCF